ncbi:MAG TPA: hypothetical protein VII38_13840 [Polyangia bacterium]|jgi:SAM-dependent methyltransferase
MILEALGLGASWGAKPLARAVGSSKAKVAALTEPLARALEAAGHEAVRATLDEGRLSLEAGSVDALCLAGLPDSAALLLTECARVVRHGGRVLVATPAGLARRGPDRAEVSALLLHAGLIDLEQKLTRGTAISSGRVRR